MCWSVRDASKSSKVMTGNNNTPDFSGFVIVISFQIQKVSD